jgi:hypothetical protein
VVVGEFADFLLDIVVAVELDLVLYLQHHRFYLFQLVADIRQVLLLLQGEFVEVQRVFVVLLQSA